MCPTRGPSGNTLVEVLYGDGAATGEDGPGRSRSSIPLAIGWTFDVLWRLAGNLNEFAVFA